MLPKLVIIFEGADDGDGDEEEAVDAGPPERDNG